MFLCIIGWRNRNQNVTGLARFWLGILSKMFVVPRFDVRITDLYLAGQTVFRQHQISKLGTHWQGEICNMRFVIRCNFCIIRHNHRLIFDLQRNSTDFALLIECSKKQPGRHRRYLLCIGKCRSQILHHQLVARHLFKLFNSQALLTQDHLVGFQIKLAVFLKCRNSTNECRQLAVTHHHPQALRLGNHSTLTHQRIQNFLTHARVIHGLHRIRPQCRTQALGLLLDGVLIRQHADFLTIHRRYDISTRVMVEI